MVRREQLKYGAMLAGLTFAPLLLFILFKRVLPPPVLPPPIYKTTVSEIVKNPLAWECKTVEVEGEIDRLVTIPETRYPFGWWLTNVDTIGVDWEETITGYPKWVTVTGHVRAGYKEHFGAGGWTAVEVVYYIKAERIL